jgi:calcineurin-like phosphoesterase family protein
MKDVVCPDTLKKMLRKIWKSATHNIICSVMMYEDSDGNEVEDETFYELGARMWTETIHPGEGVFKLSDLISISHKKVNKAEIVSSILHLLRGRCMSICDKMAHGAANIDRP